MFSVQNLSFSFSTRPVLENVSFSVVSGAILAIIGPNGSGKSTLLRCLAGLLQPQKGEIFFSGALLPQNARERARTLAFLPQNFAGESELTIEEMALLGRTPHLPNYGAPQKRDLEAVERAISRVAPDLRGRKLAELSGGQRQRALLARALAQEAPILLLDEPVSSLDIRFQHEILALIQKLAREENLTVICVLHQINLAAAVADAMLLLNEKGQIERAGTPFEVIEESALSAVYGLPLSIAAHPRSGRPQARSEWVFEGEKSGE